MAADKAKAKNRAKNLASEADMVKLVKQYATEVERWVPTADVRETCKRWHAFLLETSKVTPRISSLELARVAKPWIPAANKSKVELWATHD